MGWIDALMLTIFFLCKTEAEGERYTTMRDLNSNGLIRECIVEISPMDGDGECRKLPGVYMQRNVSDFFSAN